MTDDLDFSKSGNSRPLPPAAAQAPLYIPGMAKAFFASAGKVDQVPAGTKFFLENDKASRILLKRDKMYLL